MQLTHFRFRLRSDRPLALVYALTFLTQLGYGIIIPYLTLYFRSFVSVEVVGLILAGTYGVTIFANLFGAKIIEHLSERRSLAYALTGAAIAVGLLGFVGHIGGGVLLFALYVFLLTVALFNIDLYIKHYSPADSLAGTEGKVGMFGNLGWLVGPFIGGAIAVAFNLPAVFIACAAATLVALLLFVEAKPHDREPVFAARQSFFASFRAFVRDPELRKLYLVSFGLSFVYAAWSFVPLLLVSHGLSLARLGVVYGLSALPWVLFEYPIGRLADRRFGERIFIVIGFSLIIVASFALGFFDSIGWLIAALFVGILGSSFIERTHVAAFFRRVGESDVERISVWRTSSGFAFVLGPLAAASMLPFVSLEFFLAFVGVVSFIFLAAALSLREKR